MCVCVCVCVCTLHLMFSYGVVKIVKRIWEVLIFLKAINESCVNETIEQIFCVGWESTLSVNFCLRPHVELRGKTSKPNLETDGAGPATD